MMKGSIIGGLSREESMKIVEVWFVKIKDKLVSLNLKEKLKIAMTKFKEMLS